MRLFKPGRVVMTASVAHLVEEGAIGPTVPLECVRRHLRGDWSEMDREDRQANEDALGNEDRILSSYSVDGRTLWVITESDRSATTVLLPEDY